MSVTTGALAEAVGMGLLHFTWIGLVLGTFLAVALAALQGRSSRVRYGVALGGFALVAAVPVGTFCMAFSQINWAEKSVAVGESERSILRQETRPAPSVPRMPQLPPSAAPDRPAEVVIDVPSGTNARAPRSHDDIARADSQDPRIQPNNASKLTIDALPGVAAIAREWVGDVQAQSAARLRVAAPWLAAGWVVGVLILGLRLLGGVHYTRVLRRRGIAPLAPCWQSRMMRLRENASVRNGVRVFQSTLAGVPVVVGWLRPVILMPASIFTGLPPRQVELLLAHELAHIKRLDPLVNLLQVAAETLLFFHPVVWWLSRRIREERELRCDDFAVALCGGRADYARALLHVAERCAAEPRLALSAAGGPLRRRINRILGVPGARDRLSAPGALGLALLTLCGALITGLAWAEFSRTGDISEKRPSRALAGVVEPPLPPQFAAAPMSPDVPAATSATSTHPNTAVAIADLEKLAVEFDAGSDGPPEIVNEVATDGSIAPDEPMPEVASASDSEMILAHATRKGMALSDDSGSGAVSHAEREATLGTIYAIETPLIETMRAEHAPPQSIYGAVPASEAPGVELIETPDTATTPEVDIASADPIPDLRTVVAEVEADTAPLPVPDSTPSRREGVAAPYPQGDPETVERLRVESNFISSSERPAFHLGAWLQILRANTGVRIQMDGTMIALPQKLPDPLSLNYGLERDYGIATPSPHDTGTTSEAKIVGMATWDPTPMTIEERLKGMLTPLGLTYSTYPGHIIVSTPERLDEIAAAYTPGLYDVTVRYYAVSHAETVSLLRARLGGEKALVVESDELFLDTGSNSWDALAGADGVSLLTEHKSVVGNNSMWYRDDTAGARSADGLPFRLAGVENSYAPSYRSDGCCGCGSGRDSLKGGPGVFASLGTLSDFGRLLDDSWGWTERDGMVLVHEAYDLSPPRKEARTGRVARRIDKGEGQDRPAQSPLVEATGLITGAMVSVDGDPAQPIVGLYIQKSLYQWDLESKGDWETVRCGGRFMSPTYVCAFPTAEPGAWLVAVVHVEAADGLGVAGS